MASRNSTSKLLLVIDGFQSDRPDTKAPVYEAILQVISYLEYGYESFPCHVGHAIVFITYARLCNVTRST